jgi:DNA-binding MarR family transcriptional regulator
MTPTEIADRVLHVGGIDPEAAPLGKLLAVTGRVMGAHVQRILESVDLTHAGWVTLARLLEQDELPLRDLAEACFVSPATITGVVDTLERDGLVERRRADTDRRVVRLALTDAGRERTHRARALVMAEAHDLFHDLPPAEEAVVRAFLSRTLTRVLERQEKETPA